MLYRSWFHQKGTSCTRCYRYNASRNACPYVLRPSLAPTSMALPRRPPTTHVCVVSLHIQSRPNAVLTRSVAVEVLALTPLTRRQKSRQHTQGSVVTLPPWTRNCTRYTSGVGRVQQNGVYGVDCPAVYHY